MDESVRRLGCRWDGRCENNYTGPLASVYGLWFMVDVHEMQRSVVEVAAVAAVAAVA